MRHNISFQMILSLSKLIIPVLENELFPIKPVSTIEATEEEWKSETWQKSWLLLGENFGFVDYPIGLAAFSTLII